MPRTTKQNEKIKDQRKRQILRTTLTLFCEKGYENVSIDDICKKCRVSHGLFYHYFESKEAIKNELYLDGKDKKEKPNKILSSQNLKGLSYIEKAIYLLLDSLQNEPAACFFIYWDYSNLLTKIKSYKKIKDAIGDRPVLKRFLKEIKDGQKQREIAPGNPEEFLVIYISFVVGISYLKMRNKSKENLIPSSDVVLNLFTRKKGI